MAYPPHGMVTPTKEAYRLNLVLAAPQLDGSLIVGRQPYNEKDANQLYSLRERYEKTHLVKRSREGIETIAYNQGTEVIGKSVQIRLGDRPDIVQRLLSSWLARSLSGYRFWWNRGGSLSCISGGNILKGCLPYGAGLPQGIGQYLSAEFAVRRITGVSGQKRFVIAIDVKTSILIDCTVDILIEAGFNPKGLAVKYDALTPRGVRRRYAGQVVGVDGNTLLLHDHEPGVPTLSASAAWLEPRKCNLERLVRALFRGQGDHIINQLRTQTAKLLRGAGRLQFIDGWVDTLRGFPNDLAQGLQVQVGSRVLRADGKKFPTFEVYEKPRLVFDVGQIKTDTWNQRGLDTYGPYGFERFAPKRLNVALICQASRQGHVEHVIRQLTDGIPNSKWASTGFIRRYRLEPTQIRTFLAKGSTAEHYREAAVEAIEESTTKHKKWDLVFVQTEEGFLKLRGNDNPYLRTKALMLAHQVPIQAFEWESIKPGVQLDATINNIGLAAYAKVFGIPWLLPTHQTVSHELVIGIGSFEASESRLGARKKYIGVTTVFSADGRYMLESRTPATSSENYLPMLLKALERVVEEVRKRLAWTTDDSVRFIFHVFKDFNQCEIKAVNSLMRNLGLPHAQFAFLHLVESHPFMLFDPTQQGVDAYAKGVAAAPRGLRVDLSDNEVLLCLKGPNELRQWSDGLPKPLLLRLHRDSSFKDITYLARQVFDFTCLSWRTFLPSPLPISILYSDLVARNLLQLSDVSGWSPDTILGPVGRSRWFL
jgi:hypothetical protein